MVHQIREKIFGVGGDSNQSHRLLEMFELINSFFLCHLKGAHFVADPMTFNGPGIDTKLRVLIICQIFPYSLHWKYFSNDSRAIKRHQIDLKIQTGSFQMG